MRIYIAKVNSDLTEGRGPMKIIGYYEDEQEACDAVKGKGVMGVGDGEITSVHLNVINPKEELVYGYHRSGRGILGEWRYGWVDGRDLPKHDPEYIEYLRLKEKFGGV